MISRCKRWWWLILLVPLIAGLWRVRLDVEVLNLLPDEVPAVHGLKLYQQHFGNGRELLITVRAADAEAAETAARQVAEHLRRQTNLVAEVVWQPPWMEHPEQMSELIACLWLNQPPELFRELTNRLGPDKLDAVLQSTREELTTSLSPMDLARLSYDPFGLTRLPEGRAGDGLFAGGQQDWFASADGTFRAIYVEARNELPDYRACAAWLDGIRSAVMRCQETPAWPVGVTVRYTGSPAFVAEVATGMERDMKGSALSTLVLIVGLFWWAHRSWRPLFWLVVMLALIVAGALAAGGLVFGKLNAVSFGFAAILMGLAVDYGLVLYQESLAAPHLSPRELRHLLAPSIVWSAVTTAAAFGLLFFAGLPGLAQLGTLVGVGVLLAAVVMMFAYLPLVARQPTPGSATESKAIAAVPPANARSYSVPRFVTVVIGVAALAIIWRSWPPVDHSTIPLQPRNSPAQHALNELQAEMNRQGDPLVLVMSGPDEATVARLLDAASAHLARAEANGTVRSFLLPTALWPHPDRQRLNLIAADQFAAQAGAMQAAALKAGFNSNVLALTESLMQTWQSHRATTNAIWPTNQACRWLLKRAVARGAQDWVAVGMIQPGTNGLTTAVLAKTDPGLPGVWLTGWTLLGESLLQHVEHRLGWLVAAMVAMVTLCLWLAFHRWSEVLLSFATLGFSGLVLLAVMSLAGWSWNLMNLMALPLLLGAGVDYTIHIQLALRRHGGDVRAVRQITGRAVFLCAATTVAGFGSNALSSNAGLASLGLVCSVGIAALYFSSIWLLPAWWRTVNAKFQVEGSQLAHEAGEGTSSTVPPGGVAAPSSFYRAWLWKLGLTIVRFLPAFLLNGICLGVAEIYHRINRERFEVVVRNLLPALQGDRQAAEQKARQVFRAMALKIADLWRFESGALQQNWINEQQDWDLFQAVRARGQGMLLITPHLGNWELGGLLVARHGHKLLVLTQPEPGGLTELRKASRAKWGIETLVVGNDGFAFVEIIKRLQAGEIVALLVDRPPAPSAVAVELFGRPFLASIAAAELARASGCALVGVTIVRVGGSYTAHVLPEITYDRRALGNREARRELTQKILRAFEPEIHEHLDQWYHFVPIWPDPPPREMHSGPARE